ncbi:MAG TPA: ADP-ribosylglycohydrolase family protein [Thermotogota bacterium]|nr:ADP-ribosylglycohydrolase family protein [Thermotogota bacterium]HPR96365.1 ADP-ribosylglycohydrolase family protein [Thermotogota bacterium]
MKKIDRIKGCLLGGAIGDALGFPVEFSLLSEIKEAYGDSGITELQVNADGVAEISDDTQMTLFTAEGLLCAETKLIRKGSCKITGAVYEAYLRWLKTQGYRKQSEKKGIYNGWLIQLRELQAQRAPGNTCLGALNSHEMGTIEDPLNDSKGCGGVMRVAPVGLFIKTENAFDIAAECAAITHGHPTGYLAAGVLGNMIALLLSGEDLETAVERSMSKLNQYPDHEECFEAVSLAVRLAASNKSDVDAINELGEGWIAEEALAIAVFCSLRHKNDFKKALIAAVNHDGDSDSTGAITGNILGAYLCVSEIPGDWVQKVELSEVICEMAEDLAIGYQETEEWRRKYPGY